MDCKRAILLLNNTAPSGGVAKPLMLEAVLFSPILTWVTEKLRADGVGRFFVVCGPEYAAEARACLRPDADVVVSEGREDLLDFLREDGDVAVISGPVLPAAACDRREGTDRAFTADAATLRSGWDGTGFASGGTALDGFVPVSDWKRAQNLSPLCRDWIVDRLMDQGVSFVDRRAVYLSPRTEIGRGTMVLPGTILRGETHIGRDCVIGPNAVIDNATIGDNVAVNASQVQDSVLEDGCDVGPYAHIRPNCTVGKRCHVGAFVQLKNCVLGEDTKMSHLTYVGDADVGIGVNFGCGTITSNYDGFQKYRCTIGDNVFIGCNTNLVAPVTVGAGAYIAAGTTVTDEVPPEALAIGRARQENKPDWAARRRARKRKDQKKH